ncbi:MAG: histidine kinase N-terminal 7TM domain-containing protein [Candidatus Paceibacterota bacterium]|jgi:hypothetical protein
MIDISANIDPDLFLQILTIFLWSGAALSVFFGIFTWLQGKRSPINILFALAAVCVALFMGASAGMLNNCGTEWKAYFWDKIVYCQAVFIPILLLHFSMVFSKEKNRILRALVPLGYFFAFSFLSIVFFFPQFLIQGLFNYTWGCHSIAQPGHNYLLVYFISFLSLFFGKTFVLWRKTQDPVLKVQSKYIFISFLFLFCCSLAFLPGYKIPIWPIVYVSPLIWLLILTYVITKHSLLNAKVIIVDVLAALVVFTAFVYAVVSKDSTDRVIRIIFFFLILVFGWLAARGVHREIDENDRLEAIVADRTKELEQSKQVAEERAKELEKWYNLTVGRELRMAELKKQIQGLEGELKTKDDKPRNNQ